MNLLAKEQVSLIEADVERARITLWNLSDELVDHICCEVEQLMLQGKSFEEAYSILKDQTGIKVLQRIQENTLYLIDKKYRLMKTTMKITGNISLALLALGTLFKIFHWPGAGICLVVGFALLCFFFFPAVVYVNHRDGNSKSNPVLNGSILIGGIGLMLGILFKVMHWPMASMILFAGWSVILLVFLPVLLFDRMKKAKAADEKRLYVLGVFALLLFEASTMFKMFHWPGAGPMMILGSVLLVGIFLPVYTYKKMTRSELKTGQFIYIITISMYAVVLTALLAMNVSADVLGCFTREQINGNIINSYFEKKAARAQLAAGTDSIPGAGKGRIKQVLEEAAQVKELISGIKLQLVQQTEQVNEPLAQSAIANPRVITRKDNYDLVNHILLDPEGNNLALRLRQKLDTFMQHAQAFTSADAELSGHIFALLSGDKTNGWEEANFRNVPLINALSVLTTLEEQVNGVEQATIQYIQHQAI